MERVFRTASDDALVALVGAAKTRLVIIAPALTKAVAEAVAARMPDHPNSLLLTIILDADPAVYRMGYGDLDALTILRAACAACEFDLRTQAGLRIGLVMSDDQTMVYSPVPRHIEAGSTSNNHPNAIFVSDNRIDAIAEAAGAPDPSLGSPQPAAPSEIGSNDLSPAKLSALHKDLEANPPQAFELSRKVWMVSSKVEYVELSVTNYRLGTGKVDLPSEFQTVIDPKLRERIMGKIATPFRSLGPQDIAKTDAEGSPTISVDQRYLDRRRKDIEDAFTYLVPNKGRIILKQHKARFQAQLEVFKGLVTRYQSAMKEAVEVERGSFQTQMAAEFLGRWRTSPPEFLTLLDDQPTDQKIDEAIRHRASLLFDQVVTFKPPELGVNFKGITADDIHDKGFRKTLETAMFKAGIKKEVVDGLFESGVVAPAKGAFHRDK